MVECLSLSIRGHRRCTFLQFPVSAILGDTYLDRRGEVGQPGNRPLPLRMVSVGNSRAWKLTAHTPLRMTRGAQSMPNTEPGCTHRHTRRGRLNAPGREVPSLRRKDVYASRGKTPGKSLSVGWTEKGHFTCAHTSPTLSMAQSGTECQRAGGPGGQHAPGQWAPCLARADATRTHSAHRTGVTSRVSYATRRQTHTTIRRAGSQ